MFFYLLISKLKHLQSSTTIFFRIRECSLCSLRFSEVIDNFAIFERLLDIFVRKVYYRITVGPNLTSHTISKEYLLLSVIKQALYFSIFAFDLLNHLRFRIFFMILSREDHLEFTGGTLEMIFIDDFFFFFNSLFRLFLIVIYMIW